MSARRRAGTLAHVPVMLKGDKAQAARQERLLKEGEAIAKMLMNHKKTDLNVKHPTRGHAALHLAALQGQVAIAKLLLETGGRGQYPHHSPIA